MKFKYQFWQLIFVIFVGAAMCIVAETTKEDLRPPFDKSFYQGTVSIHVNPWWRPSRLRHPEEMGGPNYAYKKHSSSEEWASCMEETEKYGINVWQVELVEPHIGYWATFKEMLDQAEKAKRATRLSIFLSSLSPTKEEAVTHIIEMFSNLAPDLKKHPNVYRIDGKPVVLVYTALKRSPEEWHYIIQKVEEKLGSFVWLMNLWDHPLIGNILDTADYVHRYLPCFDGISAYGNWTETQQKQFYAELGKVLKSYPNKIFEGCVQSTYANHYHTGGVAPKLSEKYRNGFDIVLSCQPDSLTLTNFFDHVENSLLLPCYEREDFMLRYTQYKLSSWNKTPFISEKEPELILANYVSVLLGLQDLDFEISCFPIDHPCKEAEVTLEIYNTSGEILHKFPPFSMDLSQFGVTTFSLPSLDFYSERAIVPQLTYTWNHQNYKMNYNPMTLLSPSIRPYMMFWSRSSKNQLTLNKPLFPWNLSGAIAGETKTLDTPFCTFTGDLEIQGCNSTLFRIMRNGLELREYNNRPSMKQVTALTLPDPAEALNWYHLEIEDANGNRYQTLPVWVVSGKRPGTVKMPILEANKSIREIEVEAVRVPFFYYPCNEDNNKIIMDISGHFHHGRVCELNVWGSHLEYTGYYHYHNSPIRNTANTPFAKDVDGKGMLKLDAKRWCTFMGGTAFPGSATYELSICPDKIGEEMPIVCSGNQQIELILMTDGSLKLIRKGRSELNGGTIVNAEIISQTRLSAGKWYRIAVTYDLKTLKLYIDNVCEGEKELYPAYVIQEQLTQICIGAVRPWGRKENEKYYQGAVREIRFYGRNLLPNEFLR